MLEILKPLALARLDLQGLRFMGTYNPPLQAPEKSGTLMETFRIGSTVHAPRGEPKDETRPMILRNPILSYLSGIMGNQRVTFFII